MKPPCDTSDVKCLSEFEEMPMLLCSRILYKYENIDILNGPSNLSYEQIYAKIKAIDMNQMDWEDKRLTEGWLDRYKDLFG